MSFRTIIVCGKTIPTECSYQSILSKMPDEKSKLNFITFNNKWVINHDQIYNPLDYIYSCDDSDKEILALCLRLNQIYKIQIEVARFLNFDLFMQSRALGSWHEAMRANFTGGDPQTIRKQTTKLIKITKGKLSPASFDASPIDKASGILKYTESSLSEYLLAQEYSIATSYEYLVESTIAVLYTSNKRIESLTIKRLETEKKLAQIAEKELPIDYLFCCPFCGSRKYVPQGKTPKSCGDPKCEDAYKIAWEQKNRPAATHDPEAWVMAFGGKRRSCTGIICSDDGGKFRQVNDKCLCRECYDKSVE